MAIGEKIKYFRNMRGLTQKALGIAVGFSEKTADVRIAQYESGSRTPKKNLLDSIAIALGVSVAALSAPEINTVDELMQVLFALEEKFGVKIREVNGELCICVDIADKRCCPELLDALHNWKRAADMLEGGEISLKEYKTWCYNCLNQSLAEKKQENTSEETHSSPAILSFKKFLVGKYTDNATLRDEALSEFTSYSQEEISAFGKALKEMEKEVKKADGEGSIDKLCEKYVAEIENDRKNKGENK